MEIESLSALDDALARDAPLSGLRLQDLDLRGHDAALLAHDDVAGLVVLGGHLSPALERHLRRGRAVVFPSDPAAPIDPYRARLYHPQELYAGLTARGYQGTPDAIAYQWYRDALTRRDAFVSMLRAIHDDSMGDALDELVEGRRVVGIMGGHAVTRGSAGFRQAADLANTLAAQGLLVATGGGPGAMEAANLGAFARDTGALTQALVRLADVPSFRPDVGAWAAVALDVRRDLEPPPGTAARSVGIPTWFYGHEPPNVFADGIAKFFSNAVREDGLLARCNAGVVVLPGAAGTVQEIFQTAARLYYRTPQPSLAPLVLLGHEHWTRVIPVWSVLKALAAGRGMEGVVHLVDDPSEVPDLLRRCRSTTSGAPAAD